MTEPAATRISLHAVAELLLAGPQYQASGTIRLRTVPGGFGCVAAPHTRVEGTHLVTPRASVPLDGLAVAEVAAAAGLVPRPLLEVYAGGSGLAADHRLTVSEAGAQEAAEAFGRGEEALASFAPDRQRVLWPEHFDLALTLDEVNYGVSPGDAHLPVPYAYVGPWEPAAFRGAFWNAPFGAARPLADIPDLRAFYAEGRALTGSSAPRRRAGR